MLGVTPAAAPSSTSTPAPGRPVRPSYSPMPTGRREHETPGRRPDARSVHGFLARVRHPADGHARTRADLEFHRDTIAAAPAALVVLDPWCSGPTSTSHVMHLVCTDTIGGEVMERTRRCALRPDRRGRRGGAGRRAARRLTSSRLLYDAAGGRSASPALHPPSAVADQAGLTIRPGSVVFEQPLAGRRRSSGAVYLARPTPALRQQAPDGGPRGRRRGKVGASSSPTSAWWHPAVRDDDFPEEGTGRVGVVPMPSRPARATGDHDRDRAARPRKVSCRAWLADQDVLDDRGSRGAAATAASACSAGWAADGLAGGGLFVFSSSPNIGLLLRPRRPPGVRARTFTGPRGEDGDLGRIDPRRRGAATSRVGARPRRRPPRSGRCAGRTSCVFSCPADSFDAATGPGPAWSPSEGVVAFGSPGRPRRSAR